MKYSRKVVYLTLLTLTIWSCAKTDKREKLNHVDNAWADSVTHDSIEHIKDGPYTIGFKLRDKDTNKVDTFLINDNNPFISKNLLIAKDQYDQGLQKQGSFMYDISNTNINEIKPMLTSTIPDDSLVKYRFSRAATYCNHQIFKDYLIVNYTLSVHAFKKNVNEVISLSTKLLILNEASKKVFDISERGLGIGDVLISNNKNYLTIYAVDFLTGKANSSYRVYDFATKELIKSYAIPDGVSVFPIQSKDNVFLYAYSLEGTSGIVRILLFNTIDGQLYQKEVDGNKNLSLIYYKDGIIHLTDDSEDTDETNFIELKLSDLVKVN